MLTAIDILILPDQTMLDHAKAWNRRLLASYPKGFRLDENHTPHITLLQRYVQTDRLDAVCAAVDTTVAAVPVASLDLTAVKLAHMELAAQPGVGLAGLVAQAGPAVIELQAELIKALDPYTGSAGTSNAYVTRGAEPNINEDTLNYVERYVPEHSGANYLAHVTVGEAHLEKLHELETEQLDPFTFHPADLAIYHLGNNGTAQVQLHTCQLGRVP